MREGEMFVDDFYKWQGFTRRPYRMKRLEPYAQRMSKDNLTVIFDDNVASVLTQQGYSIQEAPRSVYKVEKLYEALSRYAPINATKPVYDEHFTHGVSLAYACFSKPKDEPLLDILPFTPATIQLVTSNPSGSPGLTNYGCTKAESQTRALERGLQILGGEKGPEPCLAFKRTQFDDKTRLVWGYPYSMTAIEGLVAYPLIQRFKGGCTPMAFAIPSGALGTKLRVASYHNEWAYSLDMSAFDATISAELIKIAFKILRTWYDTKQVEPISGKSVGEVFNIIETYFITTPIVMPDLMLYTGKRHGVPSGSFFTQMIDSVVNVIIGGTISHRFNLNVPKQGIFVLGDDLLMWSNRRVNLDAISQFAAEHLHVKLHGSEKSSCYHYDDVIHYLGRDWVNGLPTLAESDIIKRMVYPESFRKYSKDPEARERQVRLLILSFAAQYYAGWSIAYRTHDPSGANYHRGCANVDVGTYKNDSHQKVDADFLSGLMRYRMKYFPNESNGDIPNTAYQYWL